PKNLKKSLKPDTFLKLPYQTGKLRLGKMPKKLYFKRISYYVNQLLKINYTRIQAYFPEFPI
ncbi:hypothetical protein R7X48_03315, partial [Mesomycoplasma ovipneumoniae]